MSLRAAMEAGKKPVQSATLPRGVMPRQRSVLAQHASEVLPPATAASPGFGHDWSRVSINPQTSRPAALSASPRVCPLGGACQTCPTRVQAKLEVGQPDDVYEREADRVAEQVMRRAETPEQSAGSDKPSAISRQLPTISRTPTGAAGIEVSPDVETQIQGLRGGGRPLSESERAFFEPHFGQDFSRVRIHADGRAAGAARAVHARAFTVGQDVVFGSGHGKPETVSGVRLLAHELAHVLQQNQHQTSFQLQRSPETFGEGVSFEVIQQCPPAVRVLGSFPDNDIAAELYGDGSHLLAWSPSESGAIDVDMYALREDWRPYFADSTCATEEAGGPSPSGSPATALVAMKDVMAFFHAGGGAVVHDLQGGEFRITAVSVDLNHADVVPATEVDTATLRDNSGYHGEFCAWCCDQPSAADQACARPGSAVLWGYRACRVQIDSDTTSGRWIAAAHHCCPHAVAQDGYNFHFNGKLTDHAEGNQYPGHFCLHFLHSKTHRGNAERADAQKLIKGQAVPQETP